MSLHIIGANIMRNEYACSVPFRRQRFYLTNSPSEGLLHILVSNEAGDRHRRDERLGVEHSAQRECRRRKHQRQARVASEELLRVFRHHVLGETKTPPFVGCPFARARALSLSLSLSSVLANFRSFFISSGKGAREERQQRAVFLPARKRAVFEFSLCLS